MSIRNPLVFIAGLSISSILGLPAQAEPRQDQLTSAQAPQVRSALDRIPDNGRKLLALRSYLRVRNIEARWSWTQGQIDAYAKTDQYATAMAAVAAVSKAFEVKNPGHTLRVNTDVRSLDEQIAKWNDNGSVKSSADALNEAATKWLTDNPKAGPNDFRNFLTGWSGGTVMLAAPGLSLHGRGMAFDFQVINNGKVMAGADSASSWRGSIPGPGGWDARLREAVKLSTMPFDGPLDNPDEPWHYDYKPPTPVVLAVDSPADKPDDKKPDVVAAAAPDAATATTPAPAALPVPVPVPAARPTDVAAADSPKPEIAPAQAGKSEPAKAETAPREKPQAKSGSARKQATTAKPERKKATKKVVKKKRTARKASSARNKKRSGSIIRQIFR